MSEARRQRDRTNIQKTKRNSMGKVFVLDVRHSSICNGYDFRSFLTARAVLKSRSFLQRSGCLHMTNGRAYHSLRSLNDGCFYSFLSDGLPNPVLVLRLKINRHVRVFVACLKILLHPLCFLFSLHNKSARNVQKHILRWSDRFCFVFVLRRADV